MEEQPRKSEQLHENRVPKRHLIPVKSRYLNFTKKGSSQSDNVASKSVLEATNQNSCCEVARPRAYNFVSNSTQVGYGNKFLTVSTPSLQDVKPGKVSKTSTPTKDISLFAADLSVVPVGTECETQKKLKQEDPAKLEEEVLLQDTLALCLETLYFLVEEQQFTSAQAIDMQLSALQNAVQDSGSILATLDLKMNAAASLTELREDLAICENAIAVLSNNTAFLDSKSFKDLTSEVENVLNQLPCKNVRIPNSLDDLDELQDAGTRLSSTLSMVLQDLGKETAHVSRVRKDMAQLDAVYDTFVKANASMRELMPMATAAVLDEVSRAMANTAVANIDIKL